MNKSCIYKKLLDNTLKLLFLSGIALASCNAHSAGTITPQPTPNSSQLDGEFVDVDPDSPAKPKGELLNGELPNFDLRGWDYVYSLLAKEGISRDQLNRIFVSNKLPKAEIVNFNARPKEPSSMYRKVNTKENRENAIQCWQANKKYFRRAEALYHVPQEVILAILQVETHCGKQMGKQSVFYRLARLVQTSNPDHLDDNYRHNRKKHPGIGVAEVKDRAEWLKKTFLPHLVATIKLAKNLNIHPLDVRGSVGGAIGMPQFLPGNIMLYGQDGNSDNRVDLTNPSDAILSVAFYLNKHGWRSTKIATAEQHKIILKYNASDAYATSVLALAKVLANEIASRYP